MPDYEEYDKLDLTLREQVYCALLTRHDKNVGRIRESVEKLGIASNTIIMWTNELGKGNSHTLDNIPFVLVGNGLNFRMGRSLKYDRVPHNRLLLTFAHAMGHEIDTFGKPELCNGGTLPDLA